MPDVSAATHSEILSELDSARHHSIVTRDANEVTEDRMGVELADSTLLGCIAAVEKLTDRDQIVSALKRAYDALPMLTGGPARPVVEDMRNTLVDLWKRLDAEA
jgi:hypothetical protein